MALYPSVHSSLWHNENDRHQQDQIFKSMKEGKGGEHLSLQSSILQKTKLLLLRISSQVSNSLGKLVQVLTF